MQPGDRELTKQIKAGDTAAFNALIDRLYQKLLHFVTHIVHSDADAEDVVQSLFMNIWRRSDKWNPKNSIDSYLFRSAMNAALNHLRAKKHHKNLEVFAGSMQSEEFQPERILHREELDYLIQKAVDALPDNHRIPFILSRFLDLKYKQIAEVLEISEKAVERRIGKALKALKERLEPYLAEN